MEAQSRKQRTSSTIIKRRYIKTKYNLIIREGEQAFLHFNARSFSLSPENKRNLLQMHKIHTRRENAISVFPRGAIFLAIQGKYI